MLGSMTQIGVEIVNSSGGEACCETAIAANKSPILDLFNVVGGEVVRMMTKRDEQPVLILHLF